MFSVIFTKRHAAGELHLHIPFTSLCFCISNEQPSTWSTLSSSLTLSDPWCSTTCSLSLVCCEIFIWPPQGIVHSASGQLIVLWLDLRVLSAARPGHNEGLFMPWKHAAPIITSAHCDSSFGTRLFFVVFFLSFLN